MWGLIYVGAFLVTFAASAVLKMTWHPLGDKYSVRWDDSVGTVYTDLPYGEGDANKFDLYLPADNSMETYGLVVYLHAGASPPGINPTTPGCSSGCAPRGMWRRGSTIP